MPTAYCLIKPDPHYRRDAFDAGLRACGYMVSDVPPHRPVAGDVLVIWNRYGMNERLAVMFEAVGCPVIVVENGYWGADEEGRQFYALSRGQHHHGGASVDLARLANLPQPAPWRTAGDHILVCGQRGIGSALMGSPDGWAERFADGLRTWTRRRVRVRQHPGRHAPAVPLTDDLVRAHAVVIWSSNCGVTALLAGIPVFCAAPQWIGLAATRSVKADIEDCFMGDRRPALERIASNQWSVAEIAAGAPFRALGL